MHIHKFNTKPKTNPPKKIQWRPLREVKYAARKVNSMTWEIFSQEDIKPKGNLTITIRAWLYDE